MISKNTPVANLEALLMGLEVPCTHDALQAWDMPGASNQCPDCRGSGVRHPLQMKCTEQHSMRGSDGPPECCYNGGYIFNPDAGALFEAVRAKGWEYNVYGRPDWEGDRATIAIGMSVKQRGLPGKDLGVVEPKDGIRGTYAVKLALARALETTEEWRNRETETD